MRIGTLVCAILLLWGSSVAIRGQAPARSVWDGVFTDAQSMRGAALYAQNCALCHGPTLAGADGPPLSGVDFAGNWNGLTLADLFDRIRTSMPSDDPAKMSAQEKVDVLAYMLSSQRFPAGTAELPRDAQLLMQIRFQATKP
jgi:quinoprotein glucose dehydrogenase